MNVYKDFMYHIRKLECETPYLIIKRHPSANLKRYVKLILEVTLEDGKYHVYYGELKKIITSFLNFYMMNSRRLTKDADEYKNTLKYDEMIKMYDDTFSLHESLQKDFIEEFQPIESPEEQEQFDAITLHYSTFKKELLELGDHLKSLIKQYSIDEFAQNHFEIGLQRTSELCDFAHIFISKMLAARIVNIRISLEELLHGIQRNMTEFSEKYDKKLTCLYNKLYDLNKEHVIIARRLRRSSTESAEVTKQINIVKKKIEKQFEICPTHVRLIEEVEHYSQKLAEFEEIAATVGFVKAALDQTIRDYDLYNRYEVAEPPGDKVICWNRIGENLTRLKKELEEKYPRACRQLITFFACRGMDRILYSDLVGSYYVDEYGHQCYITDYGAKYYHVNCMGEFQEDLDNERYYYDDRGRYVITEGEKLYQLAPCTSRIQLTEGGFLRHRYPCDCNYFICSVTEDPTLDCAYGRHDLTDTILLPKAEPIDIKKSLDTKTVEYLWNTFGWILPEVLNQVVQSAPKNPIHYTGHLLLTNYHNMSKKVEEEKKKMNGKYREDILQGRLNKIGTLHHAWKANLYKPCKVVEFDTEPQDSAYKAYRDTQRYNADLQAYYYN